MGFGGTKPSPTPNPTTLACSAFKPISWSKKDTLETAKQVIEHNKVWKALCSDVNPHPNP